MAVLSLLVAGGLPAQRPAPKPAPVPKIKPKLAPEPWVWDFDFHLADEIRAQLESEKVQLKLEELRGLDFAKLEEMSVRAAELSARMAERIPAAEIARMTDEIRWQALDQVQDKIKGAIEVPMKMKLDWDWPGFDRLDKIDWVHPGQGTPEDSLYRSAREALNRGEYGRAAGLFQSLEQKYPKSRYAPDAPYYQAIALYRAGSTANLRSALEALRVQQEKYPERAADPDVGTLRTRIYAALAARGDASAAAALRAAGASGASCDEDEMSVRAEALNALTQLDPENANAALKKVLTRRDECSVALRRRAVYLIGRSGTEQSVNDLMEVARSDPDLSVRSDAISQLGRSNFASVNSRMLVDLFNSAQEDRIRQSVLSALRSKGGPESRAALRSIIERTDVSERLRTQAISQLAGSTWFMYTPAPPGGHAAVAIPVRDLEVARERGRVEQGLDEEDAAFLRNLYPRTDSRNIKSAIISAIGRTGGSANDQWLMGIVRNTNEDSSLRSEALSRIKSLSIEDLGRLYDDLSDREFRSAIVSQLSSRKEPGTTEKLIEIAKTSTDRTVRTRALNALTRRKDDAKAMAFIRELVEKP